MSSLSRRGALFGASCLFGCAHTAFGQSSGPASAGGRDCDDLTAPPPIALTEAEQETHTIFLLLAMALVFDGWGVDRRRPDQIAAYAKVEPGRVFADYLGHNIGALLVDKNDAIVCFALNRNVVLNSTLEHAEARTVRAAIQIANRARGSPETARWSFGDLLRADRLYATLEPCAQCSGILELANVGSVIFGQDDPGQHHVGNVLYNLNARPDAPGVAFPIQASFSPVWDDLAAAYRRFVGAVPIGGRQGLTSFLETADAYRVFRAAAERFETMRPGEPANAAVLEHARGFRTRWRDSVALGLVPT